MVDYKYKATIFGVVKKFDGERNALINGWNDNNQHVFYSKHLDPIVHDICVKGGYIDKVGEILDLLERSKNEIDSLVTSTGVFYAGTQHERGDRAGGTSSSKDNINIAPLEYLNNNNKSR